jgi:hypothetical protein
VTTQRKLRKLAERGRRLASQRDDLIAAGFDPAELPIPLHPLEPIEPVTPRRSLRPVADPDDVEAAYLRALSWAYLMVAFACLGALAGCTAAMGATLSVNPDPTWHTWVTLVGALGWGAAMVAAAAYAGRLRHEARAEDSA